MEIGKFYWLDSMKTEAGQLEKETLQHYYFKGESDYYMKDEAGLIPISKNFGPLEEFKVPELKQDWFKDKSNTKVQVAYFTRLVELNTAGNVIVNINTFYNVVTEEHVTIISYYE